MLAATRGEQRRAAAEREESGVEREGGAARPVSCPAEVRVSDRVELICDGEQVVVSVAEGETLLTVLREQLGVVSVKDGCAPQGQCGCCTVLVDGEPRPPA